MFQDFRISTIDADLKNKSVIITATFEVDPETVTDANIQLYSKESRNECDYVAKISGKVITLELTDWPIPNVEYVISVQNLKTVLGDELVSGVRRKLIFESSICSKLKITYPAFDEVIDDLRVAWEEILAAADQPYVNSYYIEISTENAFHNVLQHLEVADRNELNLTELSNGQYYVRGRVQKDGEYGAWSEVVTFVLGDQPAEPGPIFDSGDTSNNGDDIYTPDINIVSTPTNGETPSSILIEFDCEIDPDMVDEIIVIRRKI